MPVGRCDDVCSAVDALGADVPAGIASDYPLEPRPNPAGLWSIRHLKSSHEKEPFGLRKPNGSMYLRARKCTAGWHALSAAKGVVDRKTTPFAALRACHPNVLVIAWVCGVQLKAASLPSFPRRRESSEPHDGSAPKVLQPSRTSHFHHGSPPIPGFPHSRE